MDFLFHFVISLVGGFVFLELTKTKYSPFHLLALTLLSLSIDVQHLFEAFNVYPVFHAVYFALIPSAAALFFFSRKQMQLAAYSLALSLMLFGHLLSDMIQGLYGVPLLYPLSRHLFMLPNDLSFILPSDAACFQSSPIIGAAGLAMALYFGLVFAASMAVLYLQPRK
jgi:membrane-bound metal-dependent hydrolase YbcI (DUF457 family)